MLPLLYSQQISPSDCCCDRRHTTPQPHRSRRQNAWIQPGGMSYIQVVSSKLRDTFTLHFSRCASLLIARCHKGEDSHVFLRAPLQQWKGGGNINPGLHSVRSISGQTTTIIRLSITGHFQRGNSGTKTHQLRPYSCYLLSEHSCNSCQASQRSTQKCKIIKLDQLNIYISIFIYLCDAVIRAHTKCACPHVFICSLKRDLPRAHVHLTVEAESVGQGSRLVWLLALTQSWVNNAALISG